MSRFDIYLNEHGLCIDVYFISIESKRINQTHFKLSFIDVLEYDLRWDKNYSFYNVERYKLLKCDMGFYLSLAPADESVNVLEDDAEIIISTNITGCFL
ncbi:hypothetical protein ACVW0P_000163 [Mucilaginibacter sp. UYNi724]